MTRPVFSFRPNLQDEEHRRAWEVLQSVPNRQRNQFVVKAILKMEDAAYLERIIREAVREELKGIDVVQTVEKTEAEQGLPEEALAFINMLQME